MSDANEQHVNGSEHPINCPNGTNGHKRSFSEVEVEHEGEVVNGDGIENGGEVELENVGDGENGGKAVQSNVQASDQPDDRVSTGEAMEQDQQAIEEGGSPALFHALCAVLQNLLLSIINTVQNVHDSLQARQASLESRLEAVERKMRGFQQEVAMLKGDLIQEEEEAGSREGPHRGSPQSHDQVRSPRQRDDSLTDANDKQDAKVETDDNVD